MHQLTLFPSDIPRSLPGTLARPPARGSSGIGEFKVISVQETAQELGDNAERLDAYWRKWIPRANWFDPAKEALVVILLNTRYRILGHNLVSLGLLDQTLSHPREVFRPAIAAAAHSIVVCHNHPSGDPSPSGCDIRMTRELCRAGQLLRLPLVDHVVIGTPGSWCPRGYVSMRELGHLST